MSEALALAYEAPDLEDFGERIIDGKKLILYIGDTALVDVVEREIVEDQEVLGPLLLRLESTPDRAMDLLRHPWEFTSPEVGRRIFDPPKFDLVQE